MSIANKILQTVKFNGSVCVAEQQTSSMRSLSYMKPLIVLAFVLLSCSVVKAASVPTPVVIWHGVRSELTRLHLKIFRHFFMLTAVSL